VRADTEINGWCRHWSYLWAVQRELGSSLCFILPRNQPLAGSIGILIQEFSPLGICTEPTRAKPSLKIRSFICATPSKHPAFGLNRNGNVELVTGFSIYIYIYIYRIWRNSEEIYVEDWSSGVLEFGRCSLRIRAEVLAVLTDFFVVFFIFFSQYRHNTANKTITGFF
jgi:hypothetical protein